MLPSQLSISLFIIVAFGEARTYSSSVPSDLLYQSDITTSSSGQGGSRNFDRIRRYAGNQQNYTIELLVAIDQTMIDFHGKDKVEEYVLTLLSSTSNLLLDKSIGNPINLAIVEILTIEKDRKAEGLLDIPCNGLNE